jgi:hypothetical protein
MDRMRIDLAGDRSPEIGIEFGLQRFRCAETKKAPSAFRDEFI